jgi:3-oxoacyl-[acyl-carrier protein] reductase
MPRNVVVTGSSSGIGRAIASAFADQGDRVLVHGFHHPERLAEVVQQLCEQRPDEKSSFQSVIADLSSVEGIYALIDAAYRWQTQIDVWIHAAGADVLTGSYRSLSFEEKLEKLWLTDVRGTVLATREVATRMQKHYLASLQSGTAKKEDHSIPSIVTISWDQAEYGMEGDSGQYFAATKGAIAAFTKSLAKTVGPHVRVNCIAPGWIQTQWGEQASEAWDRRATGESILKRWGTPQDIANAALVLCSKDCEFINGQVIAVNGGFTRHTDETC